MVKDISFFSLKRQYNKIKKQAFENIEKVFDKQAFIGGHYVQEFEKKFAGYVKSQHAISCNSGTDSLWMALKALDIKKDSIVLTTPFSFIASSSEIVAHGAHPVFIDVDPVTYNIDLDKMRAWLQSNTIKKEGRVVCSKTGYEVSGILFVDIFGQCADYQKIKEIAKEFGLWIIEDACQAVGATDSLGQAAGTLGDISCFSFYPTKNLGAFGDGGACTTNNEYLAEKLIQVRNHGRKSHYNYEFQGINSRMDAVQATILSLKLDYLDEWNNARRAIAKSYSEKLSKLDFIKTPQEINGKHVYHQYCMQIVDGVSRDDFAKALKDRGVGTNVYYPKNLDEIEFLNKDLRLKTECPIAKKLSETILALPIWPELEKDEVEYVCDSVLALHLPVFAKASVDKRTNSKGCSL